jgi:hypothetical protein
VRVFSWVPGATNKNYTQLLPSPFALLPGSKKQPATPEPTATNTAKSAQPALAPAATAPDAAANGAETTAKLAAAAWALKQSRTIRKVSGRSRPRPLLPTTTPRDRPNGQATGAPNVENYGDNGSAWAPKTPDAGIEWLDLKYPKPVHAEEVRIRESWGSGAIIKVEVFDEQGAAHTVWAGNDPTTELNYLLVKTPKTAFKTDRVKITLATNVILGWNEIDAVQLVGSDQ